MRLAAVVQCIVCSLSIGVSTASAQNFIPPAGSVCDVVAAGAGRTIGPEDEQANQAKGVFGYGFARPFSDFLVKGAVADIDGDGDLEVLSVGGSMGTAGGDYPAVFGAIPSISPRLPGEYAEGVRWAYGKRWLHFGAAWHLVYFSDEQMQQAMAVVTVTGGWKYACSFDFGFDETVNFWDAALPIRVEYEKRRPERIGSYWDNMQLKGEPLSSADRRYIMSLGKFSLESASR